MSGGRDRATIRVAVVGAGRMGSNHARVLAGMDGVTLVGIFDGLPESAAHLAEQHSVPVLADLDEVAARSDAAIVAVSSSSHAEVGTALLERGLPCLIEKPFATTRDECDRLIKAAKRAGVCLAVGHVERFNPAVAAAQQALAGAEIMAIASRRLNPGSTRIQDTDVVMDLMLHDIDTVLHFVGADPARIAAQGVALGQSDLADHAHVLLAFPGGAIATLTASRIAAIRVRDLTIICRDRTLVLDYLAQGVRVTRDGADESLPVEKAQPLERELDAFLSGVRDGGMKAGVSAEESLRVMGVVWSIQEQMADQIARTIHA